MDLDRRTLGSVRSRQPNPGYTQMSVEPFSLSDSFRLTTCLLDYYYVIIII